MMGRGLWIIGMARMRLTPWSKGVYVPRSATSGLGMMCMAKLMTTWEKELAGKPVSCEHNISAEELEGNEVEEG